MLSSQKIQKNWPTIKSHVLSRWNKLSESEVEKTHGDRVSLGKLVHGKYGKHEEFDKTFEKICMNSIPSSRNTEATFNKNLPEVETEINGYKATADKMDEFHSGSPERLINANFASVEHSSSYNDAYDDEGVENADSAHDSNRHGFSEFEDNIQFDTHYISFSPDEFSPFQDPSASREDVSLGRSQSSATNQSTAQAASNSSDVSSKDDAK